MTALLIPLVLAGGSAGLFTGVIVHNQTNPNYLTALTRSTMLFFAAYFAIVTVLIPLSTMGYLSRVG